MSHARVSPIDDEGTKSKTGGESNDFPTKDVSRRQTGLFPTSNSEHMKEKIRRAKLKPPGYDVTQMYHEKGIFQAIARHWAFENTTLSIIVINAFWIWIDTDYNDAETIDQADLGFVVMDSLFFSYFVIELFIRFCAFKSKWSCWCDGWFVFDSLLVALYAFDPFIIGIIAHASGGSGLDLPTAVLRLFRLARLSRLVRMLRSMPELMIMIKGMVSALGTVGYTLGLLLLFTYVFAIALVNLRSKDSELACIIPEGPPSDYPAEEEERLRRLGEVCDPVGAGYFSTVPNAILSLLVYATFLDNLADFIYAVKADTNSFLFILTWLYILLAAITIMNMLIGVLCAVIDAVAAEEKESMMVDAVKEKFGGVVNDLDLDKNGTLSWPEFQAIMVTPTALSALESMNVDCESLIDCAEDFFFDDGDKVAVTFEEFMDMILDLRGGQTATVKDIYSMGKRFHQKHVKVVGKLDAVERRLDLINRYLSEKA